MLPACLPRLIVLSDGPGLIVLLSDSPPWRYMNFIAAGPKRGALVVDARGRSVGPEVHGGWLQDHGILLLRRTCPYNGSISDRTCPYNGSNIARYPTAPTIIITTVVVTISVLYKQSFYQDRLLRLFIVELFCV